VRTIYLKENGAEVAYDGNHELDLAAIIVNDERHELLSVDQIVR
jgi:hypothetical protein